MKHRSLILTLSIVILAMLACGFTPTPVEADPVQSNAPQFQVTVAPQPVTFNIVGTSHLAPLVANKVFADFPAWLQKTYPDMPAVTITVDSDKPATYIRDMLDPTLGNKSPDVDAYIPGSRLWLPTVPPGYKPFTQDTFIKTYDGILVTDAAKLKTLGWDPTNVSINDIALVVKSGALRLASPSPSDDSGAQFDIAMSTYQCGHVVLLKSCFDDQNVLDSIAALMKNILRSAENPNNLVALAVSDRTSGNVSFDAAILDEAHAIQLNQLLEKSKLQPMTVIYVQGALAVSDSPIVYNDNGNSSKLAVYKKLVEYLKTDATKALLGSLGYRTTQYGMQIDNPDLTVFKPDWGIITDKNFLVMYNPIKSVIAKALATYQVSLRRPSYRIACIDMSGSMGNVGEPGSGLHQVDNALQQILIQTNAEQHLIQAGPDDVFVPWAFTQISHKALAPSIIGNDPASYTTLYNTIHDTFVARLIQGNTNMFGCVEDAYDYIAKNYDPKYSYSVVAFTDGSSNAGPNAAMFAEYYKSYVTANHYSFPTYGIAFGAANTTLMHTFETTTKGFVYDATGPNADLNLILSKVFGNN